MSGDSNNNFKGGRRGGISGSNGFKALGLSEPVYAGIVRMGFRNPTPVQRKALPVVLTGLDACVMARTGSGKTIAFLVPLLEKLLKSETQNPDAGQSSCRAVILSPTRELSIQTLKVLLKLSHFTELKSIGIHGGEGMEKQFNMLASRPDIIVATPGRLAHHLTEIPDFNLHDCIMCILDEGDRCMEMGFAHQIRQIARTMPEHCQKTILSATMPKSLVEFTKSGFCTDPQVVRLDQECSVSKELRIAFLTCRTSEKDAALLHVMHHIRQDWKENAALRTGLTIIFAATRHHVEYIHCLLQTSGFQSTLIYGTLDQNARKCNLAAFRQMKKSILVVTDVAARGIDVPLIDHVIHYHFPPDAKLFVHRSGRAARAGRIGFCWGLVDPEEMPYMVDLHLILGRKPTNSNRDGSSPSYTLEEMNPDMVHYGSLPVSILAQEVETVQRLRNTELAGSKGAESLRSLSRVCTNAMKQYRRTRPEASRDAVRRAKGILEGTRLETGQRTGKGRIPTHPLLRATEEKMYLAMNTDKTDILHSIDNFKSCETLLEEIAAFRPKETVFEAFASGATNADLNVAGQVDQGRTLSSKKSSSAAALTAVKNIRRQMKTVRNEGAAIVVAGSFTAQKINDDPCLEVNGGPTTDSNRISAGKHGHGTPLAPVIRRPKKFLSKAERRRQAKAKKEPCGSSNQKSSQAAEVVRESIKALRKHQTAEDFRDPAFYITNDIDTEGLKRARKMEAAMQPSAGMKGIVGAAHRIEEAMLDVVGDENEELVQKQRMTRWDKSKRKYVQTTVGAELSCESKTKKVRLESGQLLQSNKMKLGELYARWQKKTNCSIGRIGVFDDAPAPERGDCFMNRGVLVGKNKSKKGHTGDAAVGSKSKSAMQIQTERVRKQNLKIKNMKKGDRKRVEKTHKLGHGEKGNNHFSKKRGKKGW